MSLLSSKSSVLIRAAAVTIALVACAASLSLRRVAAQADAPDLILYNGKIVTVDAPFTIAQAVAIRNGRFARVGDNQSVRRLAGPATQSIDLRGRTVVPGLADNHLHS